MTDENTLPLEYTKFAYIPRGKNAECKIDETGYKIGVRQEGQTDYTYTKDLRLGERITITSIFMPIDDTIRGKIYSNTNTPMSNKTVNLYIVRISTDTNKTYSTTSDSNGEYNFSFADLSTGNYSITASFVNEDNKTVTSDTCYFTKATKLYYTSTETDTLLNNSVNTLTSRISTVETNVSTLQNAGYITKSVSNLDNYSTTTTMNTAITNAITNAINTKANSSDVTTLANRVTALENKITEMENTLVTLNDFIKG